MISWEVPLRTISVPNAREHWAAKARRVKKERVAVRSAFLGTLAGKAFGQQRYLMERMKPWVVTLTRVVPGRSLDDDNLSGALKAVRDEVAAILGVDDGGDAVRWRYAQERGKPKSYAVRIEIESREAFDAKIEEEIPW